MSTKQAFILAVLALMLLSVAGVFATDKPAGNTGSAGVAAQVATTADSTGMAARMEGTADSTGMAAETDETTDSAELLASKAIIRDDKGEVIYPMSPERQEKQIAYSRFNNIWRFISFFISLGVLLIFLFTGLSAKLRDWTSGIKSKFLAIWAFMILFIIVDFIFEFPFSLYRDFLVEKEFGFMNQTFWGWFGDGMKSLAISMVLGIIPMFFFYRLVERTKKWWLWFSLGAVPFVVLMIVIAPVVISPMFNKFGPMQDKQLESQILAEAQKAGIEGSKVFEVDASKQSSKLNAYVTGLFGTKRIVLYDTMIKDFTPSEIKFVMGHEMGHYVMHHIWWGLLITLLFIAAALWLTNLTIHRVIHRYRKKFKFDKLSDPASLPLVLIFIMVISFVFDPVTNGYSRHIEHEADIYGMNISGVSGNVAATAFDKLGVFNLSDPDPHPFIEFWFYDHPALKKRMDFVRNYHPTPN